MIKGCIALFGYEVKDKNLLEDFIQFIGNESYEYCYYKTLGDHIDHSILSKAIGYFENHDQLKGLNPELLVSFGGDGTILSTVEIVRDLPIPILGVNLGRLGFLATIEKQNLKAAFNDYINGRYKISYRSLLEIDTPEKIFGDIPFALNDFTLHKRDTSTMVIIHTFINGHFLNSYWADGLIVSTPTGSTGYSLSCGGPIIFPEAKNFVLTPVAPHNLNIRPLVIPDDAELLLKIEGRASNFLATADSRSNIITSDQEVTIRKAGFKIQLLEFGDISIVKTLRNKLNWGKDIRN